jgi:GNAT superfamily N-acetyltransferase
MAVFLGSCISRISHHFAEKRLLAAFGSGAQFAYTTTSHKERIAIVAVRDPDGDFDENLWQIGAFSADSLQRVATLGMTITESNRVYIDIVASWTQGRGIATKLVQAAIEVGLQNGCQGHLDLESMLPAIKFWEKCGLTPSGGPQIDDSLLPMTLPDDQVTLWKYKIFADPIFLSRMMAAEVLEGSGRRR